MKAKIMISAISLMAAVLFGTYIKYVNRFGPQSWLDKFITSKPGTALFIICLTVQNFLIWI